MFRQRTMAIPDLLAMVSNRPGDANIEAELVVRALTESDRPRQASPDARALLHALTVWRVTRRAPR